MRHKHWLRIGIHLAGWLPLVWTIADLLRGRLGYDPLEAGLQRTGRYALAFLLLSLLPTTLRLVLKWSGAMRERRALGLYAFGYAVLHAGLLIVVAYGANWALLVQGVGQSPFILVGLVALLILLLLAITSTDQWVRRLGAWWRRLHRLTYVAAFLTVWHYAGSYKELRLTPVLVGLLLLAQLGVRLLASRRATGSSGTEDSVQAR